MCSKYKIELIEDAAEALGSLYRGKHVGYFGRAGVLSFNGNKIITTGGGGAIITNSKKFADKIKLISTNFRKPHRWLYKHNELGFNYRMPSLNAQLGIAQIKKLKNFIKLKRSLYKIWMFSTSAKGIKEVRLAYPWVKNWSFINAFLNHFIIGYNIKKYFIESFLNLYDLTILYICNAKTNKQKKSI